MREPPRRGRGRDFEVGYSAAGSSAAEPVRDRSPAEKAHDAAVAAEHSVAQVGSAIAAVRKAAAANDPAVWDEARTRVDKEIRIAKEDLALAREHEAHATSEARRRLETAKTALAEHEHEAAELGARPSGFTPGPHDAAILGVLGEKLDGSAREGFADKEGRLGAIFAQLRPADSLAMAKRIRRGQALLARYHQDRGHPDRSVRAEAERTKPTDPVVEQLALLTSERVDRLLALLEDRDRLRRLPAQPAAASNDSPAIVAANGVAGPGQPLPHADTIQASFGKHRVSHVGGAAAEASAALGAEAYATGDDVAFARSPDLRTAAHEAAHVVQQHAGVQLHGGLDGRASEPLEQHADAVADAVARGESAEPLLDALPRGAVTGAAQRLAVQRKGAGESTSEPPAKRRERIALYVMANENPIRRAIYSRLQVVGWPDPAARLTLSDGDAFAEVLAATLRDGAELSSYVQIAGLLYPDDPEVLLGSLVPATDAWVPTVGLAFAHALERGVVASLHRLGPRYLAAADARGIVGEGTLDYSALAPSMPIDRWVGRAMTYPRMVSIEPPAPNDAKRARGKPTGLRTVKLVAEGANDPALWQYVRAVSPADATPEEVAATLFQGQGESGAYYAYRLAAAGPLFGLPAAWARQNALTKAYAPPDRGDAQDLDDRPEVRVLAVAGSQAADELALHEAAANKAVGPAAAHPPAAAQVIQAFGDCQLQLGFIADALVPWGLVGRIVPAQTFVTRAQVEVATAEPSVLASWAEVAAGQSQRLYQIAGAIRKLTDAARKLGVADPQSGEAAPLRSILELLASAAGTSQLGDACRPLLQQALDRQAALDAEAVQGVARDLDRATSGYIDQGDDTAGARALHSEALAAEDTLDQLQTRMVTGAQVDAGEIDEATLHAEEVAIQERVIGTEDWTHRLGMAAIHAKDGISAHAAALFSGRFQNMPALAAYIIDRVGTAYNEWVAANKALAARLQKEPDSPARAARQRAGRRANLAVFQQEFQQLSADRDIATFLNEGAKVIQDQEFRTACIQTAVMIGISIAAAGVSGLVAEAAGESLMAAEGVTTVADLSTTARVAAAGEGMLADAGVNALGQQLTSGGTESFGAAFAENLLMSLGMSAIGVVGKLGRDADLAGAVERRSAGLWAKVGGGLKEGAVITAHTITGAAIGYVAHRIVTHKAQAMPSTIREWLLQGASIAVGRYVHTSMGDRMPGLERLARRPELPEGPRLLAEGRRIDQLSRQLEASKQPDAASDLLEQQTKLLDEVTRAIEKLAAEHGDPDGELAKLEAGVAAQRAELRSEDMLGTRLQLAGMTELVPGALWKGSRAQIDDFLARAKKSDPRLAATHDSASGRWHLRVDGHEIQVQEVNDLQQAPHEHGERSAADGSSGGDTTQNAAAAHRNVPDAGHRLAASLSGLDGRTIAAQVPGTTYEPGGTFRIATEHGQLEVSIRRTTGAAGVVRDGEHATIEIPRGLTGADLESATVEQLRMARAALARGAASGGSEHADNASMPTSVDEASARKASGEHWSNKQVRDYYNAKNGEIPALDEQWKQQGLTAEQRARKAYEIRHGARMVTREMMGVAADQLRLLVRDAQKYGDGEGPTFEELVAQQEAHGLRGDAVYEAIVSGAERTDKATNERVKNERTDPRPQLDLPSGVVVHGDRVSVRGTNGRSYDIRIKRGSGGRTRVREVELI